MFFYGGYHLPVLVPNFTQGHSIKLYPYDPERFTVLVPKYGFEFFWWEVRTAYTVHTVPTTDDLTEVSSMANQDARQDFNWYNLTVNTQS